MTLFLRDFIGFFKHQPYREGKKRKNKNNLFSLWSKFFHNKITWQSKCSWSNKYIDIIKNESNKVKIKVPNFKTVSVKIVEESLKIDWRKLYMHFEIDFKYYKKRLALKIKVIPIFTAEKVGKGLFSNICKIAELLDGYILPHSQLMMLQEKLMMCLLRIYMCM